MGEKTFLAKNHKYLLFMAISALIAFAIIVRMYFLIIRGGLHSDQLEWAREFYYGGITIAYIYMRTSLLSGVVEAVPFSYLPGYPLFLAIFELFSENSLVAVRVSQLVLDSLAILLLYITVSKVSRSRIFAILSCAVYAIAPWWVSGSTYLLAESLLPALWIALLFGLVTVRDHPDKLGNWIVLGLGAAVLPFFRTEMMLLFIPLVVWAVLVAPAGRRVVSTACVSLAFAAPLFAWAVRNYVVHGLFLLTPQVKWYAAWSGLGQVPNEYGYFVSDTDAAHLLLSKGIGWHSAEAELFWKSEYLQALTNHPMHVLETVIYRLKLILVHAGSEDISIFSLDFKPLLWFMLAITLSSIAFLLFKRRWSDAFLVALPAGYAICSLAFLYVEPRYVRYATIGYLLGLAVFLSAVSGLPVLFFRHSQRSVGAWSQSIFAIAAVIPLAFYAQKIVPEVRSKAVAASFSERSEFGSVDKDFWLASFSEADIQPTVVAVPIAELEKNTINRVVPELDISRNTDGLRLKAKTEAGRYLMIVPLKAEKGSFIEVNYEVVLESGGLGIGVLSGDESRWLSFDLLSGASGDIRDGSIVKAIEPGSSIVITAERGGESYSALIKDFRWKIVCPVRGLPEPLGVFLYNEPIIMEVCARD